jgi:hypothetical protein
MSCSDVLQHLFGDRLGPAVGTDRHRGRAFAHRSRARDAVDGGGGGEDNRARAGLGAGVEQRQNVGGVVGVVARGLRHGLGHHGAAGEMDHARGSLVRQNLPDGAGIAQIGVQEPRPGRHAAPEPGRQVVKHADPIAAVQERPCGMAADVAGTACDQNFVPHAPDPRSWQSNAQVRVSGRATAVGRASGVRQPPDRWAPRICRAEPRAGAPSRAGPDREVRSSWMERRRSSAETRVDRGVSHPFRVRPNEMRSSRINYTECVRSPFYRSLTQTNDVRLDGGNTCAKLQGEPPRGFRRLQRLGDWSYGKDHEPEALSAGASRARRSDGARA